MEYIYPENLKSKATLGPWELRDIAIIGCSLIFGIFVFARTKLMLFMIASAVYAFMTVRVEDMSVKDFIAYASAFFITGEQHFEWRKSDEEEK